MALNEAALAVGRQIINHVARAWLGVRKEQVERTADLSQLLAVSVADRFHQRSLQRQLEQIGDQVATRLQPLYEQEFRGLPENERLAALDAVIDALSAVDLGDRALFDADADAINLAKRIRKQVPQAARRAGMSGDGTVLYDRLLDESCHALVRIMQQLPAFNPRALTELLGRTSHLAGQIGEVLERMPRATLTAPRGTKHDAAFRSRYLELISEGLDELELFGVDVHRYRPRARVSVAYLSLTVADDGGRTRRGEGWYEDGWSTGEREVTKVTGVRVEEALAAHGRTLLRGEAGSGKTTLLQWLAVSCARGTFTGALASWNGRAPFLIRLRSYADQPMPGHKQFLSGVAEPLAEITPAGWVYRQLKQTNGAVLLVDGVDELVPPQRHAVRQWLRQIVLAHPQLPVVVTSRTSAADQSWLRDIGFGSVVLEPMGSTDIVAFCERWHEAIRDATRHDPAALPCAPEELAHYQAALLRHLDANRHLRALATNPLLCAMLCALNLDRRRHLPPDRMALYDAALHLLLERRDAERDVPAAKLVRLTTRDKIVILQHLAWGLTLAGRAELPFAEVVERVERSLERLRDITVDATTVTRFLLERSGVIREPVERRVDFVHKTFQEYLAAKEATDDHKIDVLTANAHADHWREAVIMAAGHATTKHTETLLIGVLDRAEQEPRNARTLRLLAAACADTAHAIDPAITTRIDRALDTVMPPRGQRETRPLALIGTMALRKLPTSLDGLSDAAAAACVCTAALINGPDALHLLAGYASDPRPSIQRKLAEVWGYFDAEEYAKSVLAMAPLDHGIITVRRADQVAQTQHLTQLARLTVAVSHNRADLSFLDNARHMVSLAVRANTPLDLSRLSEHAELEEVSVWGDGVTTGFTELTGLANLTAARLVLAEGVNSIDFVANLPSLTELRLHNLRAVTNLRPIIGLRQLTSLDLSGYRSDPTQVVEQVRKLAHLFLWDTTLPGGLDALNDTLGQLIALRLGDILELDSIASLRRASALETLWLSDCRVADISPLTGLSALSDLTLVGTLVSDLDPLSRLEHVRRIDLRRNLPYLDLSPLARLPQRLKIWLNRGQKVRGLDAVRERHRIKWL